MRLIFSVLLLAAVLPAEEAPPLLTLPCTVRGSGVYLQARVNDGRPMRFLFDTAAGWHAINWRLAEELKLSLREHAAGAQGAGDGKTRAAEVLDAKLKLGNLELPFSPASAINLDPVAGLRGDGLEGLVGAPLLKRYVVEVDLDAATMKLYDPATFRYGGPGQELPVRVDEMGTPYLKAALTIGEGEPIEGEFKIDSAAGATLMFASPFAAHHRLLAAIRAAGGKTVADSLAGVGGTSQTWYARLAQLRVGATVFDKPVVTITEAKGGTLARTDIAGAIGAGLMHRFKVTYDCPHNRIYLEPTERIGLPFERDMSGVSWSNAGGEYRVRAVAPDSAAAHAGMEPGDVLVSVDGRTAAEFTPATLGKRLMTPGKVRLVVRRGQHEVNVELTLARLV